MSKIIKADSSKLIDTLHRIKSFLIAAQFLNRNNEEIEIALMLLSQSEEEIDEVLENE